MNTINNVCWVLRGVNMSYDSIWKIYYVRIIEWLLQSLTDINYSVGNVLNSSCIVYSFCLFF